MFFRKREKSYQQKEKEDRVMWIHEHASYMSYVDEVHVGNKEIYIEGPHVKGIERPEEEVLLLDCNGEEIGRLLIKSWETKKQGTFLGSVNTGEYLMMTGDLISGERLELYRASMVVNYDIFSS